MGEYKRFAVGRSRPEGRQVEHKRDEHKLAEHKIVGGLAVIEDDTLEAVV